MPSRERNPCTPKAGALRGSPESITITERRARARVNAPDRPAAPPPMRSLPRTGLCSYQACSLALAGEAAELAESASLTQRDGGVQQTRVHVRVWNGRKVGMKRSPSRARGSRPPVGRDVPPEVPFSTSRGGDRVLQGDVRARSPARRLSRICRYSKQLCLCSRGERTIQTIDRPSNRSRFPAGGKS